MRRIKVMDSIKGSLNPLNKDSFNESSHGRTTLVDRAKRFINAKAEEKVVRSHESLSQEIDSLLELSKDEKAFAEYKKSAANLKLPDGFYRLSISKGKVKTTLIPPEKKMTAETFKNHLGSIKEALNSYCESKAPDEVFKQAKEAEERLFKSGEYKFTDDEKEKIKQRFNELTIQIKFSYGEDNKMRVDSIGAECSNINTFLQKTATGIDHQAARDQEQKAKKELLDKMGETQPHQIDQREVRQNDHMEAENEVFENASNQVFELDQSATCDDAEGWTTGSDTYSHQSGGDQVAKKNTTENVQQLDMSVEPSEVNENPKKRKIRKFANWLKSNSSKDKTTGFALESLVEGEQTSKNAGILEKIGIKSIIHKFKEYLSSSKGKSTRRDHDDKLCVYLEEFVESEASEASEITYGKDSRFKATALSNVTLVKGDVPVESLGADAIIIFGVSHDLKNRNIDPKWATQVRQLSGPDPNSNSGETMIDRLYEKKREELNDRKLEDGEPCIISATDKLKEHGIQSIIPTAKIKEVTHEEWEILEKNLKWISAASRNETVTEEINDSEKIVVNKTSKLYNTYVNAFNEAKQNGNKVVAFKEFGEQAGYPREVALITLAEALRNFKRLNPKHGITFKLCLNDTKDSVFSDVKNKLEQFFMPTDKDA